jgi:hypothetical protein
MTARGICVLTKILFRFAIDAWDRAVERRSKNQYQYRGQQMKTLFLALILALGLLAHETASAQTVASCPTATAGSTWNPKTQWLECSDLTYIAEPIPATSLINDMRCSKGGCVFSWMLPAKVLPTDQTWVHTTAKPAGIWVASSTLKFASAAQCSTLIYIGAPMTITNQLGGIGPPNGAPVNGPPWPIGNPVVGMIQLNAPLPPSATTTYPIGSDVSPGAVVAWDFTSEYPPFITGSPYYTSVTFTTDANDNITDWNFVVEYYDFLSSQGGFDSITSTPAGDTVSIAPGAEDFEAVWLVTGISKAPGKWLCLSAFVAQAHL